jgi:hypothetical protein
MSDSSAQDNSSITFVDNLDTITLDTSTWANMSSASGGLSNISITSGGSSYSIGVAGTYSTSIGGTGATVGGITSIGNINSYGNYTINLPEEWVNCFPDFDRIEKMCKEYPGLAIAFDKFKTTYKLVRDDYDTPKNKRSKP